MSERHDGRTVVLRMGSLGDIVLASAVTGGLGAVVFVCHARWVDAARRLPGVTSVVGWPDTPLPVGVERVVDLQGDLRARVLTARMRPARVSRIARFDWQRRARVWLKSAPAPRVVERYARAAGVPVGPRPWLAGACGGGALGLVPGARWATKRWPLARWVELGRRWDGPVEVLGGPSDAAAVAHIAAAVGSRARPLAEVGFDHTWDRIARCRAVVAGDTGLLHVAGAMGVPVVGLFGPTTAADGFWCHAGETVARALDCRPCSRHGTERCPLGHHACLEALEVDAVEAALRRVVAA